MQLQSYLKEIRKRGSRHFTLEQLMHDLGLSKNAAINAIYRIKKHGDIISPTKGLYVIVPPEHQRYGSIPAMELVPILMKHLQSKYYVSLLSVAELHGATHQKISKFQIITNKRIKHPLEFGQIKLEIVYKKSLDDLPFQDFPVSTGYLKVASPELTLFDLFHYSLKSGGLNHIATVLAELMESIDADKLIELAEKIKEKAWLQRLGFILDKIDTMNDEKSLLIRKKLQKYLDSQSIIYVPLAPELSKKGSPYMKKWKIIENTDIESDL